MQIKHHLLQLQFTCGILTQILSKVCNIWQTGVAFKIFIKLMLGKDISIAYLILKNSDRWSPPCSQKTAKKALNLKLP